MRTQREALQQALKALEIAKKYLVEYDVIYGNLLAEYDEMTDAITAIRAALAEPVQEPVQEPVAWAYQWKQGNPISWYVTVARWPESDIWHEYPLYTAPQQAEPTSRASLHVEPVQEHLRGAQSGEPLANRLANHPRTLGSPMSDQGLDDILSEHVTVTDPNLHRAIYMAMRDLEAAHGIVERPCTCHPDDSPLTPQQEVQEPVAWGAFSASGRR